MATHPIDRLLEEHRYIEEVLNALERFADHFARGRESPTHELALFSTWIHGYADAIHHGKEEFIFMAWMPVARMPGDEGPLALMLAQHQQARLLVDILTEGAASVEPWTESTRRKLALAAIEYTELLRDNIRVEDHAVFETARARVPSETWEAIAREFDDFEATHAVKRSGFEALGRELIARHP